MATKEIMAFSEADIKNMTLTVSEFDTLKFLAAHAGIEMDEEATREFVAQRNARINEIVSISELKAKAIITAIVKGKVRHIVMMY